MNSIKRLYFHLRRAPFQSLAAVLVTVFAFATSTVLLSLIGTTREIVNYFETRPEISAYIKDDVDQSLVQKVIEDLNNNDSVKSVTYISKDEALKFYREITKDNPLLSETVTADILPASLEISAIDAKSLGQVASYLNEHQDLFEEILFPKDIVDFIIKFANVLNTVSLVILFFLGFLSLMIIAVIVGMKITLFKNEIEILRLLGGGSMFIQLPYLLEGLFYGLIGPLLGGGLIFGIIYFKKEEFIYILESLKLPVPSYETFLYIFGIELVFGMLVGIVASLFAVRKHLK
jgi:Cell division protein